MQKTFVRNMLATCVVVAIAGAQLAPAYAQPAVQGPESVQDWWEAGQEFVRDAEHLNANERRAKNVIFLGSTNARLCADHDGDGHRLQGAREHVVRRPHHAPL